MPNHVLKSTELDGPTLFLREENFKLMYVSANLSQIIYSINCKIRVVEDVSESHGECQSVYRLE